MVTFDKTRQDKTRELYLARVAQSAARLVSLGALGSIGLTYTCCSSIFTLEQFVFELGQNSLNWYKIV